MIYDEPSARWHILAKIKEAPDPKRPEFKDSRVIETVCGMTIALVGHPNNRPSRLTLCVECHK